MPVPEKGKGEQKRRRDKKKENKIKEWTSASISRSLHEEHRSPSPGIRTLQNEFEGDPGKCSCRTILQWQQEGWTGCELTLGLFHLQFL